MGDEAETRFFELAATVVAAAHDWNDELTIILSSVDSLSEAVGLEHKARHILLELRDAARRCAWISSAVLTQCPAQALEC